MINHITENLKAQYLNILLDQMFIKAEQNLRQTWSVSRPW